LTSPYRKEKADVSNIAWVLLVLAAGWLLQLGMTWRQARRFTAAVAALRRQGSRVSIGMGRRRLRKSYVALAVDGVTVTRALVLAGTTVFADARPEPRLAGQRVTELARGRPVPGLPEPVRAAAAQAAGFVTAKSTVDRARAGGPLTGRPAARTRVGRRRGRGQAVVIQTQEGA
jgi:DNA-binding transcriptional regulator of glucitol operon